MAGRTAWILGDQLSAENPALEGADRVLIVESRALLARGRIHRQRLQLTLSAMRHFAAELEDRVAVDYRRATSLRDGLEEHRREHSPEEVTVLRPSWRGGLERIERLGARVVEGSLFATDLDDFGEWAAGRKRLLMEDFYRRQRRRLGILMAGGEPVGDEWNLDAQNREPPPADERPPRPYRPREDEIDERVRSDLDQLELTTFGEDGPRLWPASRAEARRSLRRFVEIRLASFGPYQDAMIGGERFMWHSHLSTSLNLGLLSPLECVEAAVAAYEDGAAPLNSVEGFVRQIIGWREFVWCLHWHRGGRLRGSNALLARAGLPSLFWNGETEMRCVADAVGGLRETGYAHHIERLMVLGNLMLLAGIDPEQCRRWFRDAFIDGNEWVMDANVLAMATHADGGTIMTKPYAASGRYIDRMSDHCGDCRFDPGARTGEDACPFTTLYWDFLDRQRERLGDNRRMTFAYRNLDRIEADELERVRAQARRLRRSLREHGREVSRSPSA